MEETLRHFYEITFENIPLKNGWNRLDNLEIYANNMNNVLKEILLKKQNDDLN